MNALDSLKIASEALNQKMREENALPKSVNELTKVVNSHQKIIIAILESMTEEQRQKFMEKLNGKSEL